MQQAQFHLHEDLEGQHWWFTARRSILAALLAQCCPPGTHRLILDVGCGTGGNTAFFAQQYRCVGVDPEEQAVRAARARFPGVEFRVGSVPEATEDLLPTADAVLLLDVLEHVEDDFLLVSRVVSGMRPGAYLVITVPANPRLWGIHDRGFGHWRRYSEDRFRVLWRGLPVREVLCSPWNARWYPLVVVARWLSRLLGTATGPAQTDLSQPPALVNALLRSVFAGERHRLLRVLHGTARPYSRGVSFLAILRRMDGAITPRRRPDVVAPDDRPWMA